MWHFIMWYDTMWYGYAMICSSSFHVHERIIILSFTGLRSSELNDHQNNINMNAQTTRHDSAHVILFHGWYSGYWHIKFYSQLYSGPVVSTHFSVQLADTYLPIFTAEPSYLQNMNGINASPGHKQLSYGLCTGLILGLPPANERRFYIVTTYLIGWA